LLSLILALLVLAGFVALAAVRIRGMGLQTLQFERELEGPPMEARAAWQARHANWLSQHGYRPTGQTDSSLTYTRTYIPTFAVVLAVVLFPIGLLALLARREAVVSVSFRPSGARSIAAFAGTVQRRAAPAVQQLDAGRP
jgi:hypothetical protein